MRRTAGNVNVGTSIILVDVPAFSAIPATSPQSGKTAKCGDVTAVARMWGRRRGGPVPATSPHFVVFRPENDPGDVPAFRFGRARRWRRARIYRGQQRRPRIFPATGDVPAFAAIPATSPHSVSGGPDPGDVPAFAADTGDVPTFLPTFSRGHRRRPHVLYGFRFPHSRSETYDLSLVDSTFGAHVQKKSPNVPGTFLSKRAESAPET